MQVVNDHERQVYNGDLGIVRRIDAEEGELTVDFEGREVAYGLGELDELVLAYAMSVHKAQGAEYPAVVIPLHTQHYKMLQRNLLYTALTPESIVEHVRKHPPEGFTFVTLGENPLRI